MLKLFLSNLSQGPIKVSLFQGQSFSQLDIYVVNHFLVIDVVFTKIPITHKMLHIVVKPSYSYAHITVMPWFSKGLESLESLPT